VQNQAFYRTGIFGNFFFGGGNFAFSKREFPVALLPASDLTAINSSLKVKRRPCSSKSRLHFMSFSWNSFNGSSQYNKAIN